MTAQDDYVRAKSDPNNAGNFNISVDDMYDTDHDNDDEEEVDFLGNRPGGFDSTNDSPLPARKKKKGGCKKYFGMMLFIGALVGAGVMYNKYVGVKTTDSSNAANASANGGVDPSQSQQQQQQQQGGGGVPSEKPPLIGAPDGHYDNVEPYEGGGSDDDGLMDEVDDEVEDMADDAAFDDEYGNDEDGGEMMGSETLTDDYIGGGDYNSGDNDQDLQEGEGEEEALDDYYYEDGEEQIDDDEDEDLVVTDDELSELVDEMEQGGMNDIENIVFDDMVGSELSPKDQQGMMGDMNGMGGGMGEGMMNDPTKMNNSKEVGEITTVTSSVVTQEQEEEEFGDSSSSNNSNNHDFQLPDVYESNLANVDREDKKTDTPLYWRYPGSSVSHATEQVFASCWDLVQATEYDIDAPSELKVFETKDGYKYVNINLFAQGALEYASEHNLVQSHLADIIVAPAFYPALHMFDDEDRAQTIIIFEDPIQRCANEYYDAIENGDEIIEQMSLEEYAASTLVKDNFLTRSFTMNFDKDVSDVDFMTAQEVIGRKTLVGLADDMEETLIRIGSYFEWIANDDAMQCGMKTIQDMTSKRPRVQIGSQAWKLLAEKNKMDMDLYEYIKYAFEEQMVFFKDPDNMESTLP